MPEIHFLVRWDINWIIGKTKIVRLSREGDGVKYSFPILVLMKIGLYVGRIKTDAIIVISHQAEMKIGMHEVGPL